MTTSPLFRQEVTNALSQQALGNLRLAQPISAKLICFISLMLSGILIAFVVFGSYTKKARVTGLLLPKSGSVSLASNTNGMLKKIYVKEGQQITVGEKIFEISLEKQTSDGELSTLIAQQLAMRRQSLESEMHLRVSQAREKSYSLEQRLTNTRKELNQIEQELRLAERRHTLAQESLQRFQTLQSSGYVSSAQVQQKQEELIDSATRVSNLQRNLLQSQASLSSIESSVTTLALESKTERVQMERSLALLEQETVENDSRKRIYVHATQTGTVTTINATIGQMIAAGQTLATLIPHEITTKPNEEVSSLLEVHLFAPSKTAGFVAQGQEVLIRLSAFPYQKFGLQKGIVTAISETPLAPNELPPNFASTILSNAQQNILGFNSSEALYRIKVQLHEPTVQAFGKTQTLKSGMTLEADIVQDKRSIWEWIAEPLLAVAKR